MSGIKPKMGKCLDCPPGSVIKPVIAKRCQTHYWQHRNKVNTAKATAEQAEAEQARSDALATWFAEQINIMPKECENCGAYLNRYAPWGAKTYIAHIIPKRHFESVMIHPMNRLFLCGSCHTNYDNWGYDKVKAMQAFPLAVERFKTFSDSIASSEYEYLPEHFEILL